MSICFPGYTRSGMMRKRLTTTASPLIAALLCSIVVDSMTLVATARADDPKSVRQLDLEPKDAKRDRIVPLRVYLPPHAAPRPVVLFSHGLGGSREGNPYLGNHWAAGGFVCVFMQHAGSDRGVWESVPLRDRMRTLKQAASVKSSRDRTDDVSFVIDQLEAWNQESGHSLQGRLDLERIGMSGHSFGAVTTLSVAGRKFPFGKSFREDRIDAFLAMSPQPGKLFSPERAFGHMEMPILCMTGSEDDSPINDDVTPQSRQKVFQALPAGDKYQLVFDGGHHFTFSDADGVRRRGRDPDHHPAIQRISLRFWQAYLDQDEAAKKWLQSVAVQTDCKLKQADVWQWK